MSETILKQNDAENVATVLKAEGTVVKKNNPSIPDIVAQAPSKLLSEYASTGVSVFKSAAGAAYNALKSIPWDGATHVSYDAAKQPSEKLFQVAGRGASFKQSDLDIIKGIVFGEASNRGTPDEQANEMRSILDTAINRSKQTKKTLGEIFTAPNQYQAYKGDQYWMYLTGTKQGGLDQLSAQKAALVDKVVNQLFTDSFKQDNTGGRYFYSHNSKGELVLKSGELFKKDIRP